MIHWGIIGTGKIAATFAKDLSYVPDARLVGVGSRSLETARDFASANGCERHYGNYEELVRDPQIDAVYIATPHALHAQNAIDCLRAGKSVLCEKPFTINKTQAKSVIDVAREHNVLLVEGMWTYFQPAFQRLLQFIQTGELGRILSIDSDLGFKAKYDLSSRLFDPDLGGGALLDMGVYNIALVAALLGEPAAIQANAHFGPTGVDESTEASFEYSEGVKAKLTCSVVEHTRRSAVIVFEKAVVTLTGPWWHGEEIKIKWQDGREETIRYERQGYGFVPMIQEFQRCIKEGLIESPIHPWTKTLLNMKILDAVRSQIGLAYPQD